MNVDSSRQALELGKKNFELNGFTGVSEGDFLAQGRHVFGRQDLGDLTERSNRREEEPQESRGRDECAHEDRGSDRDDRREQAADE